MLSIRCPSPQHRRRALRIPASCGALQRRRRTRREHEGPRQREGGSEPPFGSTDSSLNTASPPCMPPSTTTKIHPNPQQPPPPRGLRMFAKGCAISSSARAKHTTDREAANQEIAKQVHHGDTRLGWKRRLLTQSTEPHQATMPRIPDRRASPGHRTSVSSGACTSQQSRARPRGDRGHSHHTQPSGTQGKNEKLQRR